MKQKALLFLLILFTLSCAKEDNESLKEDEYTKKTQLLHTLQSELINNQYEPKDHFNWDMPIIEYNSNNVPYIIELESKKVFQNKIAKIIFNINGEKISSQVWVLSFADKSINTQSLRHLKIHEVLLDFYGTLTVYDINSKLVKQIPVESPISKTKKYSAQSNPHVFNSACALCHRTLDEIVIGGPGSSGGGWGGWDSGFGSESDIGVIPGGGHSGGSRPPVPEKNKDDKLQDNPCLYPIYNTVMNTNFGEKFIRKVFDLDNSRFDLVWMIKNSTTDNFLRDNPGTNGYTTPFTPFNNNFKIVLNSDKFRDNPKLVIASTIIHETIHAYLFKVRYEYDPNKIFSNELEMAFPGVFDYVLRYANDGTARAQHEQMAAHYIEIVKNALKAYDNSFDEKYYDALAWLGLQSTTSWNRLGKKKQEEIIKNYKELKSIAPKMGC
ncbi:hypothetical protein M2306_001614 [Myroides gitamensis]|uniref:hypothetical protein n=1 Tax=Myroides odoratus TaxID=256 RepID=UPI0021671EC9|nr:hypothetical protein [Myroides odoratus]MCS4238278.1 hypothetical protein [Myroides odoratus]MDH6600920.1 hypothetical protein [Myroides gitamensis]